jgi:hypothetical protein
LVLFDYPDAAISLGAGTALLMEGRTMKQTTGSSVH